MGGLSPMHMGLVLVIALLVFGPKKLPEIGRELGQAIREFKKASREVVESFHDAVEDRPGGGSTRDSYHPAPYGEASYPYDPAPAAEGPALPGGPPLGTVDRAAHALPSPLEAAAPSPAADLPPAAGAVTHEPAAPERNT